MAPIWMCRKSQNSLTAEGAKKNRKVRKEQKIRILALRSLRSRYRDLAFFAVKKDFFSSPSYKLFPPWGEIERWVNCIIFH